MDGTIGKKLIWLSQPVTKHLIGRWILSPYGEKGFVQAWMQGAQKFKVVWDRNFTVQYMDSDSLIGFRVFQSREELDKGQRRDAIAENPAYEMAAV